MPYKPPDVIYVSGNPNPNDTIRVQLEACMSTTLEPLPHLRFEIPEAARILRISRATLYERIREGLITTQKGGRRTFITAAELQLCHSGIVTIVRVAGLASKMPLAPRQSDAGRRRCPVDHDQATNRNSRFIAFKTR